VSETPRAARLVTAGICFAVAGMWGATALATGSLAARFATCAVFALGLDDWLKAWSVHDAEA
jgi:hypothetical protein